jgi:hypothetical protein
MIAPQAPQARESVMSYAMFAAMGVIGLFLTYKAFGPENVQSRTLD